MREQLSKDFGIDLPISGGSGNSIENAVVVERALINDYVGVEYEYLKLIGRGRGIEWKVLGQSLLSHNNRMIDKIKIETIETTEEEIIRQVENYYFDITDCM